ncbi:UNVERIFIED_CONTAM: hypothetical protein HDU68_009248 [Siphonaria sp. JEL0065]|nr:hypothetical protein HDU68_009248 [Siphonaria sp. JEL0065]
MRKRLVLVDAIALWCVSHLFTYSSHNPGIHPANTSQKYIFASSQSGNGATNLVTPNPAPAVLHEYNSNETDEDSNISDQVVFGAVEYGAQEQHPRSMFICCKAIIVYLPPPVISPILLISHKPTSLSSAVSDQELYRSLVLHFSQWGKLTNIKVLKDWLARPYAFVQYESQEHAKAALARAHNTIVCSRYIRVEQAKVNRTLFIGNFRGAEEKELRSVLESFGPVEDLNLLRDFKTGRSKGCGFVKFRLRDDAIKAFVGIRQKYQWAIDWATNMEKNKNEIDLNSIFVGQLNQHLVTNKLLEERFGKYGEIKSYQLMNKTWNEGPARPAFAFITYAEESGAEKAIEFENAKLWLERTIRVQYREIGELKGISRPLKHQLQSTTPFPHSYKLRVDNANFPKLGATTTAISSTNNELPPKPQTKYYHHSKPGPKPTNLPQVPPPMLPPYYPPQPFSKPQQPAPPQNDNTLFLNQSHSSTASIPHAQTPNYRPPVYIQQKNLQFHIGASNTVPMIPQYIQQQAHPQNQQHSTQTHEPPLQFPLPAPPITSRNVPTQIPPTAMQFHTTHNPLPMPSIHQATSAVSQMMMMMNPATTSPQGTSMMMTTMTDPPSIVYYSEDPNVPPIQIPFSACYMPMHMYPQQLPFPMLQQQQQNHLPPQIPQPNQHLQYQQQQYQHQQMIATAAEQQQQQHNTHQQQYSSQEQKQYHQQFNETALQEKRRGSTGSVDDLMWYPHQSNAMSMQTQKRVGKRFWARKRSGFVEVDDEIPEEEPNVGDELEVMSDIF